MSQQTQNPRTTNAHQIARMIDRNNNGFSTLAQAFIDVIKDLNLTDAAAMHLYRSTMSIKQADNGSSWLLAC